MKVLQVTPTYAPASGGIEVVVENLSRALTGLGIRSDIAHLAPGLARTRRDDDGLTVFTAPLAGGRLLGFAPGLGRLAAGYDLIHVHDPQVAAISLTLFLSPGMPPRVLSTHGGFHHTPRLRWLKMFHQRVSAPLLLGGYRRVLATSAADLALFSGTRTQSVLMENGVDVARFKPAAELGPRPLNRWICWGRLSSNKRLERLIALVGQARAAGQIIDLLICGTDFDGLAEGLQAQIDAASLGGQIKLSSALGEDELRREIETRGAFVTASEYEGFGLTVVEAMAAGLIVACRDIAPLNSFVAAGQTGFFLRFDGGDQDLETLTRMIALTQDNARAMLGHAQRVTARYDWAIKVREYLAQYEAVLAP
jgi:alpha-1,3-mannosyltransferase